MTTIYLDPVELPAGSKVGGQTMVGLSVTNYTLTLPGTVGGVLDHTEVVPLLGTTASSNIDIVVANALDSDENTPDMLDVLSISGTPSADAVTVDCQFSVPSSGPVKIHIWRT